ncbi:RidA family protein [Piscinibacter sakaiensis]|uniref:RidA family protein n=1 Tax=Piscinibacter sakaiensis TaxID=1547922 RepID=UPI003AAB6351
MLELLNPADIHAPVGAYSHTAVVPAGTQLVFVAGQVGMRPDGSVPADLAGQADVLFQNLRACLAAHGAGIESIVKLTAFVVAGQDIRVMREVRERHFGAHRPASTAVFVSQLVSPDFLLEIEAVAVKGG